MKLYPFQNEVLEKTSGLNHVAYFLEMGLGKTFVGAEKMVQLGKRVNLVICQKSKIHDWINHFSRYSEDEFEFVIDGTMQTSLDFFIKRNYKSAVCVINYELAWRRKELLKLADFTLMLDESSLIQNRQAKQSKFILKLNAANVILLSGTPTSGKYENLWTQIHLLGWDIKETTYNTQYVNWRKLQIGWGPNAKLVPVVDKLQPYKNVERLKTKMRDHGAVFMKTEEVLDLPEQVFSTIEINTSKEYRKFQRDSIITLDGVELVGDTELTKRLYSRQLCGAYSAEKLQAFRDLLQSTNDRLIVFYNFDKEYEILSEIAQEEFKDISVVNGKEKILTAYEEIEDSVTFVQYQAGAMGLNLQKANKIIYFTLPDGRQDLFDQSKKRIHRIGQKNTCFYYILLCRDSVEEEILNTLNIRTELTDDLFKEGD